MAETSAQKLEEDIAVAERVLTATLGHKIHLAIGERAGLSGRQHVHRLDVSQEPSEAPQTVIMKQARIRENQPYEPDALRGAAPRLFHEWAGLEFLWCRRLCHLTPPTYLDLGQFFCFYLRPKMNCNCQKK